MIDTARKDFKEEVREEREAFLRKTFSKAFSAAEEVLVALARSLEDRASLEDLLEELHRADLAREKKLFISWTLRWKSCSKVACEKFA
jgi:RecB family exonuclease